MSRTRLRAAALIAAAAVVASACSASPEDVTGGPTPEDTPTGVVDIATEDATLAALPEGISAAPETQDQLVADAETPLPAVEPVTVPDTVTVHRPDLIVRTSDATTTELYGALGVDGVEVLAPISEFTATLTTFDGEIRDVSIIAVDHTTFRSLTPEVTANAPGVWQRLAEGDILVRHDVAAELDLPLGGEVDLSSPEGQLVARIGAFASNGAPPLADVVVPWDLGSRLGGGDVNALVVALSEGADQRTVSDALTETLGDAEVEQRQAPVEQRAAQIKSQGGRTSFEPFSYTDLGDGQIVIDPAWTRKWITTIDLPGLGRTSCHRLMVPQLFKALEEIQAAGLYDHFERDQFAGCWVPRHIDWNPKKPLSMHAWGIAIDFNSRDNWLGQEPMMDRRIVAIFEKWGFEWGGRWRRPDGMHFELDRVIDLS